MLNSIFQREFKFHSWQMDKRGWCAKCGMSTLMLFTHCQRREKKKEKIALKANMNKIKR